MNISQRWRLASIFVTLTNLLAFAAAQSSCIDNGNYTSFSTYKDNLETILSSLPTKVDIHGFYNASVGQSPDTAYAAVLCRGDIQPEECRSCIQNATAELVNSCPNYKQAVHWNELCMVRYSNESMFGILRTSPGWSWRSLRNA
ncbi:cysteine-rich repeat secretory protein 1-like [Henckelia pumila]|uniref:cysteine-rich repeat secretory protein 1-like n=1 Tax=Henckelia pumila TaxID=405737 RepID=UPI003C6DC71D